MFNRLVLSLTGIASIITSYGIAGDQSPELEEIELQTEFSPPEAPGANGPGDPSDFTTLTPPD